jgi:WD40 repeat protein
VQNSTAFSPDGKVMARSDGQKILLLETLMEKPLATLEPLGSPSVARFRFSPDGAKLAVIQGDQQVELWDLRLIRQELAQMHLDWDMPPYPPVTNAPGESPVTLEIESDPDNPNPTQSGSNSVAR